MCLLLNQNSCVVVGCRCVHVMCFLVVFRVMFHVYVWCLFVVFFVLFVVYKHILSV